jgi:hypothetical protein
MGRSLARKLIEEHLVAGRAVAGEEIGIGVWASRAWCRPAR